MDQVEGPAISPDYPALLLPGWRVLLIFLTSSPALFSSACPGTGCRTIQNGPVLTFRSVGVLDRGSMAVTASTGEGSKARRPFPGKKGKEDMGTGKNCGSSYYRRPSAIRHAPKGAFFRATLDAETRPLSTPCGGSTMRLALHFEKWPIWVMRGSPRLRRIFLLA